jgi:hypothetical protein
MEMRKRICKRRRLIRALPLRACSVCALILLFAVVARPSRAASWNSIEPLKSRRADVEKVLGQPLSDQLDESGALHFKVAGGMVTVAFVTPKFVADKKLPASAEGTVLQIVLQHDNAPETPESLNLTGNKDFEKIENGDVAIYRNNKDGIAYTFVKGKLKTTRYYYTNSQVSGAQTLHIKRPKIFGKP